MFANMVDPCAPQLGLLILTYLLYQMWLSIATPLVGG
jgi:hypothetical protein